MKYFWSYLTLIVLFIAYGTVGRYIEICGIAPNPVFVFAVCYSMYNFPVRSAVLCVIAGLLSDCFDLHLMGFNALTYMYIGLAVSLFGSSLMKKSFWAVVLGVIIVSAFLQTLNFILFYVIKGYTPFWYGFFRIILPSTIYDGIFALVISPWARWLSEEQIRGF